MKPTLKGSLNTLTVIASIAFLTIAPPCAADSAIAIQVSGNVTGASPATTCVLQIKESPWWPVGDDHAIYGRFSEEITLRTSELILNDTDHLSVDILCDGYTVYTSSPMPVENGVATFNTGDVSAKRRIDDGSCRQLTSTEGARTYAELMAAFLRETHKEERDLAPARVQLCDNGYTLFLEARVPDIGAHWIVRKDMTGAITVDYGI